MDPLAQAFTNLRIQAANFIRMDASAPWGIKSYGEPGINFVLLVRGSAVLTMPATPTPISLGSGDVFIMLDGIPYDLYDREGSTLIDCAVVVKQQVGNHIQIGGGGSLTTFVSGSFELDALEAQPILKVLPPLLHLKMDQHRSLAFQSVLEMLGLETESPELGSAAVISRLFELLFLHAIRAYAMQPSGPTHGWLAGTTDRQLARALEAIHRAPAEDWTVELLARMAGMSRSGFAARFKIVVGQTPLEYLTQWRMHCASRLLQQGNMSLAEVARRVGYESPAAFNRVFRRETSMTPGAFRKAQQLV